MISLSHSLAFIGPGGPEFLMVMLVLLLLFGAKDAPRILRKLNDVISQIRNTAEGFRRDVMYSDLLRDPPPHAAPDFEDDAAEEDDVFDPEEPGEQGTGSESPIDPLNEVDAVDEPADEEGDDRKD